MIGFILFHFLADHIFKKYIINFVNFIDINHVQLLNEQNESQSNLADLN